MGVDCRVVLDTNVVLSSFFSSNIKSPNKEILARWKTGELTLLYSDDIFSEYAEKLLSKDIPLEDVEDLLALILLEAEFVEIRFFLLKVYPVDPDDIHFLLCAINGEANYLVSGDRHLLDLRHFYRPIITICNPRDFINDAFSLS